MFSNYRLTEIIRYPGLILLMQLSSFAFASTNQARMNDHHWDFSVYLDDSKIGTHRFELVRNSDYTKVTSTAKFDVKFLFFTAYSYRHKDIEIWNNGCLEKINATTDDNGEKYKVSGRIQSNDFIINDKVMPDAGNCIKTFAYWDKSFLKDSRLLNSQTGELVKVNTRYIGKDTQTINQKAVAADRYRITGKDIRIDLWYSEQGQWLGLQSMTPDGNTIRYQLQRRVN